MSFPFCHILPSALRLTPGEKLALGKLLLSSVGRYVKVSTKKRFSGLMTYFKFCQVEVAAECGRIAIVISSTTSCFPVHKRVSFKLQVYRERRK